MEAKQMFDYNSIPDYRDFTYWFIRSTPNKYSVVTTSDNEEVYTLIENDSSINLDSIEALDKVNDQATVESDFKKFKKRPEYVVGSKVQISDSIDDNMEMYEKLLVGCVLIRNRAAGRDILNSKSYTVMIDYLRTTDLYNAPASTQYHGAFPGGLLKHLLEVYNEALDLATLPKFNNPEIASVAVVALTHDWCKIGLYESYLRNVKDESTGQWKQVTAYKRNQKGIPLGHGVTSMYMAGKFFYLSVEEALAIRWHMSRWNVSREELNELQQANENCPLVHLIQFADQLSITSYS